MSVTAVAPTAMLTLLWRETPSLSNQECQHAQDSGLFPVALEIAHVDLQTGQEHDVVKTHVAEQLETAVAGQQVESVLADEHAGQYHADDIRYPQPVEQQGREKYDQQHDQEYPRRVGYRQCEFFPVHTTNLKTVLKYFKSFSASQYNRLSPGESAASLGTGTTSPSRRTCRLHPRGKVPGFPAILVHFPPWHETSEEVQQGLLGEVLSIQTL